MKTITRSLFLFLALFCSLRSQSIAPSVTYGKLTDTDRVINEPLHIFLTNGEKPLDNSTVDLCNEDAYLDLINVRPKTVAESYTKRIKINGETLKPDVNCRLAIYRQGTVVIPNGHVYKPRKI